MSKYEVTNIGAPDQWRHFFGGFKPETSRNGRRVVDHELTNEFIGLTVNAYVPGESANYWHSHSEVEELYVFIEGKGQMGLDDEVVDVEAGSVVRVSTGVFRTWRAMPDSQTELRWLCIRAGASKLTHFPNDATRVEDRPMPW